MCRCSCAPRMPGAVRPHDRYALAPAARGTLEQNSCRLSGAGSADCALPVPPLTAHALGMCLSSSGSCARSRGGTRTTSATSWRSTVSSCCVCVCATARSWIPGGWIVWRLLGSLTGRVRLSKCLIRSAAPWRLLPLLRRPPSAPCLITHQFAAGCAVCRAQAG